MSSIEELKARVLQIAMEIQNNIRVNPDDPGRGGWGQFVDALPHGRQIGSYGTCGALLAISVGAPDTVPDPRSVAEILRRWGAEDEDLKLHRQNVRLAFLVLSLAKINEPSLAQVCKKVARLLRARQQPDGSWADSNNDDPNTIFPGRPESTAWSVLALARLDPNDTHAIRGAEYIRKHLIGTERLSVLSSISIAAALSVLSPRLQSAELLNRARYLIRRTHLDHAEQISFFDYIDEHGRVARDYLCFPAFYPLSILIGVLIRNARVLDTWRFASVRLSAISSLNSMIAIRQLYRLPGARFAATVDQAMVALTYEQLRDNAQTIDVAVSTLRPLFSRIENSWVIRIIIPILTLSAAVATIHSPRTVPAAFQDLTGVSAKWWIDQAEMHEDTIRLVVALILTFVGDWPKSVWRFVKRKWQS